MIDTKKAKEQALADGYSYVGVPDDLGRVGAWTGIVIGAILSVFFLIGIFLMTIGTSSTFENSGSWAVPVYVWQDICLILFSFYFVATLMTWRYLKSGTCRTAVMVLGFFMIIVPGVLVLISGYEKE